MSELKQGRRNGGGGGGGGGAVCISTLAVAVARQYSLSTYTCVHVMVSPMQKTSSYATVTGYPLIVYMYKGGEQFFKFLRNIHEK